MERSFIYSYVGNVIKWLLRADTRTDDIEAARKWQLQLYHDGKLDKLFKSEEKLRSQELKRLTKEDLIKTVMELEKCTLRKPCIDLLPKKTIRNILTLLPLRDLVNAVKTCKRWERIGKRESYWRTIIYTEYTICGDNMDLLLSRGTKELIINNCVSFAPTFRENPAAEYFLESLTLDTNICATTSKYLLSILQRCRTLTRIHLLSVNVTDEICVEISKNVALQEFTVHAHFSNLQQGLMLILKSCKRLQKLKYLNLSEALTEEEITELLHELPPGMQVLDMFTLQTSLRDYHVDFLVKKCPNIMSLNLRGCIKISYDSIMHLQKLSELQYLNVAWCFGRVNELQRSSRSRSKFLYIGVPFMDSLERLEGSAEMVKQEIMKLLPGVEVTLQP